MRVEAPTDADIRLWGRCLRSYSGSFGPGVRGVDPNGRSVGPDGQLWMLQNIDHKEAELIWSLVVKDENDQMPEFSEANTVQVQVRAYKIASGFRKAVVWACLFSISVEKSEFTFGWYKARDIINIFDLYDDLLDGYELTLFQTSIDALKDS